MFGLSSPPRSSRGAPGGRRDDPIGLNLLNACALAKGPSGGPESRPRTGVEAWVQRAWRPALERQFGDGFLEQIPVDDNASGVFADDDLVLLADFDLALRRNGEAGGGAPLERHDCAAVA